MSVSLDARVGTDLLGYRIEALLGRGGMGVVYRAYDTRLKRKVALKLLAQELREDDRFRQRFLTESELAASLDHPNVIPIYEAGEVEGVLFVAMRYVDGQDLKTVLRHGALPPDRAISIVGQVARALDVAHERGLVHRDVKPSNVLLDTRDHAYLADFGLTKRLGEPGMALASGLSVGTPAYVAPEQIEGTEVDGRADEYALGCLLYECLTGRPPFPRRSDAAVLFAHLEEKPPAPEGLEDVIGRALAKNPSDRYQSCGELVDAARLALGVAESRRARWPFVVAGVGAAVLGAALLAFGLERSTPRDRPEPVPKLGTLALTPDALSLVDAKTKEVVTENRFGSAVQDVALSGRAAWVLLGDERVVRVDLGSHHVTAVVKLPWGGSIASGGGSMWLAQDGGSEVVRIDARTGKISGRFSVSGGPGRGIAYGDGSLWLARGGAVARVDPQSRRVMKRFPIPDEVSWVVFAEGAVWAANSVTGVVAKIDPLANRITATAKLRSWISDLTVGGGFVWASVVPDGVVFKLSEDDLSVQGNPASGRDPQQISFGGGLLWIANTAAKTISTIEPESGARSELAVGSAPNSVWYHDGLLWTGAVPVPAPLPPIKGQELQISMPKTFIGADPSTSEGPLNEQLFYATCANLLNYPDSDGPDGAQLRPEIAAAMPAVSRNGRTYTFRIRRGFRFSPPSRDRPASLRQSANSVPETVTAETFRHTIERALSPKLPYAPAAPFASDIVGVTAYRAGTAAHIRGIVARGHSLSIRLVRPAGDFLTRISMSFFCPVPRREPVVPSGLTGAIPTLGPYYTASIEGNRTVLLRNPNYTGTRPRRAERIVYTDDIPTPQAVALTDSGDVDYLPADFDPYSPLVPGGRLHDRFGPESAAARDGRQRYFLAPLPGVDYIVFNTRRPLFQDLNLRRAVNYALDRRALAAATAYRDAPTDQVIPLGVLGNPIGHAYPIDGPDLAAARRLAGRQHRRAVLYFCVVAPGTVAEIVRANLDRIGIAVSIIKSRGCLGGHDPKADRADLVLGSFGTPERDPAAFLEETLERGMSGSPLGPGPWHHPGFRVRLEQAHSLRGEARIGAYARLARELVRNIVPFAVYGTWVHPDYFSARVGCELYQAYNHFVDLGALCIRTG